MTAFSVHNEGGNGAGDGRQGIVSQAGSQVRGKRVLGLRGQVRSASVHVGQGPTGTHPAWPLAPLLAERWPTKAPRAASRLTNLVCGYGMTLYVHGFGSQAL